MRRLWGHASEMFHQIASPPEVRGLPSQARREAMARAERQAGRNGRAIVWLLLLVMGMIALIFATIGLSVEFFGSRFNPGIPKPICVVVALAVVANVCGIAIARLWSGRLRPFLWKQFPHLCDACGYDLTGNVSGVCPECGQAVGP